MCVTLLLFRIKPFVIRNDKSRPIHIANDENVKCKRKRMVRSFQCLTLQAMSCHYLKDRDRERKKWRNRQEKEYNKRKQIGGFPSFSMLLENLGPVGFHSLLNHFRNAFCCAFSMNALIRCAYFFFAAAAAAVAAVAFRRMVWPFFASLFTIRIEKSNVSVYIPLIF